MILFTEYFKLSGRRESAARHLLSAGRFETARKVGKRWYIDASEPYPAARDFVNFDMGKRRMLETYRRKGYNKAECARRLGMNRSSITRELRRGEYEHTMSDLTTETRYSADKAQILHAAHYSAMGPQLEIGNDGELARHIEHKILYEKRSPAAILGEIEREGPPFRTRICAATLYSYIRKDVFLNITVKDLPERGRRKRSYKKVVAKTTPRGESIENRPAEVATRAMGGHWEMDTVKGGRGTKANLLVLTERKTRAELIRIMPDGTSASAVGEIDRIERHLGKELFALTFRSITVDNGSENADFAGFERSLYGGRRTKMYYCHPYSSYERGSNENQNRQIRRRVPKGTPIAGYTPEYIGEVERWINTNPRRLHGWRTAEQVFDEEFAGVGVQLGNF
jgi:IS30 family transposase